MNDRLKKYLSKEFTEAECNRIFGTHAFIIWNSRWVKACNCDISRLQAIAPSFINNWMKEKYDISKEVMVSFDNGTNEYLRKIFNIDLCKIIFSNSWDAVWRCSWNKWGTDKFMQTPNGPVLKKYIDENIIPDIKNFIQDYDQYIASTQKQNTLSETQIEKLAKLSPEQIDKLNTLLSTTTVVEPVVVEPVVVEPAVVEHAVVEPTVVEPALVEPALVETAVVEPVVVE